MQKYVYLFSEGNATMRNLLGGKGANLAEMTSLGMPVPQGFTITTEACTRYYEDGKAIGADIQKQIDEALIKIEQINEKKFGDARNPLLVSVRSGARASMPGMMDTILNLGINDEVAAGLIAGNPDPKFERFVYDSYRRFIQMFSDVVMEIPKKTFEVIIDEVKEKKGVKNDIDLDVNDMKELVARFKEYYKEQKGEDFPTDPKVQMMEAVKAVFRSWDNPRANVYRRMNDIPYSWGTAVNVQPMVFGNLNDKSGTGVAFTRNPATGEKALFGEYLINAQGEDVVAGIRTPNKIAQLEQYKDVELGRDTYVGELIDKVAVKLQSFVIDHSFGRHNSWPAHRETICFYAEFFKKHYIFTEPVIMITGYFCVFTMSNVSLRESIPYARAFTVLIICSLDLISGCSSSP